MTKQSTARTASGKPITEDLVNELAGKAVAGVDVERTLERRARQPVLGSGPAGRHPVPEQRND